MAEALTVAQATARPITSSPVCVVDCAMPLVVEFILYSQSGALNLPYAVRVNGQIQPAYQDKPKKLALRPSGSITVAARSGDEVAVHLGSDASADWRLEPLYAVQVADQNVRVHIREKKGLLDDGALLVRAKSAPGHPQEEYEAAWTGNTWMRFSHRYTPDEVASRLPPGTHADVAAAVKRIYQVLPRNELRVERVDATGQLRQVTLEFPESEAGNCRDNIKGFDLKRDGLTRVHPGGYAALINAALDNGVQRMRISSCWRPMLGSVAHRVGLGLDVTYLDDVHLNRQELVTGQAKSAGADANVSDEERRRYLAWMAAKEEAEVAEKERSRLATAGDKEQAAYEAKKGTRALEIERKSKSLWRQEQQAKILWNEERDKNEPVKVRAFRQSLYRCACVRQLFDPWYIEVDTRDQIEPVPNAQIKGDAIQVTHAHHLHITVEDARIFP